MHGAVSVMIIEREANRLDPSRACSALLRTRLEGKGRSSETKSMGHLLAATSNMRYQNALRSGVYARFATPSGC